MISKITRQEENELPQFSSHKEAQEYFIKKYGHSFIPVESFLIDEERICYRYYLILNRVVFECGQRKLMEGTLSDSGEFLQSHQPIEIMEDGSIHIIH